MAANRSSLTCQWRTLAVLCVLTVGMCVLVLVVDLDSFTVYLPLRAAKLRLSSLLKNNPNNGVQMHVFNHRTATLTHTGSSNQTCAVSPSWSKGMFNPDLSSDLTNWDFKTRVACPQFTINGQQPKTRQKVVFTCTGNNPRMNTSSTTSSSDVMSVPFGDECLLSVIDTCCTDDTRVPNVLHYVWYGKKEMGYFHFLSFMSGVKFMRPCLILVHGEYLPYGPYWDYLIQLSPNVVHVRRKRIETVYGKRLSFPEHGADVMRIEAIQKYGGLYLDFDQILLRSVSTLRQYEMTMGRVFKDTLGNQFILAKKNATFLRLWHESYKTYKQGHWTWNSLITPYKLSVEHPELIHIDGYNFTRPTYLQTKLIFKENYDWSTNYAMHLFIRWYKNPIDVNVIRTLNTTIGAISRHVFFGNKELCDS